MGIAKQLDTITKILLEIAAEQKLTFAAQAAMAEDIHSIAESLKPEPPPPPPPDDVTGIGVTKAAPNP